MRIETDVGIVDVVNEPMYSFGSVDNARNYPFPINLALKHRPSSIHGILLNEKPLAVFGRTGGASGVHAHSALHKHGHLYLAVGDSVVCFDPDPFQFNWAVQVDPATCFGVYFDDVHSALFSHGELEIARLSKDGKLEWGASGADVFTEGFALRPKFVEAIDFNGKVYQFEYESGESIG
jgi:hypothetical protein